MKMDSFTKIHKHTKKKKALGNGLKATRAENLFIKEI